MVKGVRIFSDTKSRKQCQSRNTFLSFEDWQFDPHAAWCQKKSTMQAINFCSTTNVKIVHQQEVEVLELHQRPEQNENPKFLPV